MVLYCTEHCNGNMSNKATSKWLHVVGAVLAAAAAAGVYYVVAQRTRGRRKGKGSISGRRGEGERVVRARALVPQSLRRKYAIG